MYSSKKVQYNEICTDSKRSLHVFGETHSIPDGGDDSGRGFCESEMGANKESIYKCNEQLAFRDRKHDLFSSKAEKKAKITDEKMQTNRSKGIVNPLPGILDHRDFERSSVSLGHCTICGKGPAVYQSKVQRASICDTCYARLVREWNLSEGVR